jgi:hypothetical protein
MRIKKKKPPKTVIFCFQKFLLRNLLVLRPKNIWMQAAKLNASFWRLLRPNYFWPPKILPFSPPHYVLPSAQNSSWTQAAKGNAS